MSYSFDSRIRFSEIGEDRKLTVNSIVNYFQDCSNFHSNMLNLGLDTLEERGRAWMLLSWQIGINRRPVMGEEVTTATWPYDFKGFYGYRNFVLKTKAGEVLAYANSVWVYLDAHSGVPVRINLPEVADYGIEPRLDMEYAPRKVAVPSESTARQSIQVPRHSIDVYHHVNNGQYIQMAAEYVPSGFDIRQIRAEYKHQAVCGNTIIPMVHEEEGICTIALCSEEQQPYAVIEFRQ